MSENVISRGHMAPLKFPIGDHRANVEWETFRDRLYDFDLDINYEGTLIFSSDTNDEEPGIFFHVNEDTSTFIKSLLDAGVEIDDTKILSYTCHWYNGADSYMSDMEIKEFLKNFPK